jgi:hypothetical protein
MNSLGVTEEELRPWPSGAGAGEFVAMLPSDQIGG